MHHEQDCVSHHLQVAYYGETHHMYGIPWLMLLYCWRVRMIMEGDYHDLIYSVYTDVFRNISPNCNYCEDSGSYACWQAAACFSSPLM